VSAQEVFQTKQGVIAAYVAEGFVKPDGKPDSKAVLQRVAEELLSSAVVSDKAERRINPITRGSMRERIFRLLPDLDELGSLGDQDDLEIAQAIQAQITSDLWGMVSTDADARIREFLPNGYMVARVKIGKDLAWASYLTERPGLLEEDVFKPNREKLSRASLKEAARLAKYVSLHPEDGARMLRADAAYSEALGVARHDLIVAAIEAATADREAQPES